MSSKRVTSKETEADLEARTRAAIKCAFPWLHDGEIKHQLKFSFKFGRQTLTVDAKKSQAEARLDILLEKDGKPLAVMELKRPGIQLTEDDEAQGLSYAKLLQPPAPLVVVTNGTEVTLIEVTTGKPWQPANQLDYTFQNLIVQASRVANADIRHAVDTLMGTAPSVWMQAMQQVSSDTVEELTASWDEPALPFVTDFLIPRNATLQLWKHLVARERLLILEGSPLSGKSNVLRELCLLSNQSDTDATLYVETGVGCGVFQTIADAISRSLMNWPVSPQEARDWLIRISHGEDSRLILVLDGLQASDVISVREIEDLSSGTFGPSLSLVVAMDETVSEKALTSANQRSQSPLGRRSKLVRVEHLSDIEFQCAQKLLEKHRLFLMKGADMAPEYRSPWVLRAICSSAQRALESMPDTQVLSLPSLLGPKLLELVRKQFAHLHELRRRFKGLARSMIIDAQDSTRPHELVLQQAELGIIRRDAIREELEPGDLEWLIEHGFVSTKMSDEIGSTILVRLPELLASEMASALADDLVKRRNDHMDNTAVWLSGAASNLPLGEVIAAQAIIDLAKRPNGLPVALINALVKMPPEREDTNFVGRFAMRLYNGNTVEVSRQSNGKGSIESGGKRHEIDFGDEKIVSFKNIHPWLILSHIASTPFEVEGEYEAERGDQKLLLQIGTCPVPLRGNRGPDSLRMLPTMEMPDDISVVYPDMGVIEPITLGILDYISNDTDEADVWIDIAIEFGSVALLARLHIALVVLAGFKTHTRSGWAEAQLKTKDKNFQKLQEANNDGEG